MRYHVKYEKSADKFLGKLDPPQRQLLVRWISDNLEGCDDPRLRGKPLHGRLGDYWRYRVGDFRIIASIEDSTVTVSVFDIGRRDKIYKRQKRVD